MLIGLRLCVKVLSFGLDYNQPAVATSHVQESAIWTHKHSQDREVVANLQSTEAEHWWKHTKNNVAFFCAVYEFVHVIAILNDLWADHMRTVLGQNSLVRGLFLRIWQLWQVSQKLSIDWEGVPKVIFAREECTDCKRVLCKYNWVDGSKCWMLESSQ